MNTRLTSFLSAENITQAQFADTIGVARASISHILSGRNKPGFDFIESMARHYPTLNLEWLITGNGKMYKNASDNMGNIVEEQRDNNEEYDLFSAPSEDYSPVEQTVVDTMQPKREEEMVSVVKRAKSVPAPQKQRVPAKTEGKSVTKIIIYYNDSTYQELMVAE